MVNELYLYLADVMFGTVAAPAYVQFMLMIFSLFCVCIVLGMPFIIIYSMLRRWL